MEAAATLRHGTLRLARRLRPGRSAHSLSASKLGVLSHLYRHGASTPGELAAVENHQPQSLTRVLAELEQEALVSRTRHERDRRQSLLALTPAGLTTLSREMAERDAWLAEALAELTETERQVLRLAGALMDRLADADPHAPTSRPTTMDS
jgi:DNA-binding MarR family transcriptional regulator